MPIYSVPEAQLVSSQRGAANGVASLDNNALVPAAQLPIATPSTQGAMPATEMAKTSAVTLAQMQGLGTGKLDTLAGGGWHDLQAQRMIANDPTLTGYIPFPCVRTMGDAALPTGAAVLALNGGGLRVTAGEAGDGSYARLTPETLLANAKTSHWAVAFRAAFLTPDVASTYKLGFCGLSVPGVAGNGIFFGEYYTYGDHTKIVVIQANGAPATGVSSSVVDNGVLHDWILQYTAATLSLSRDGASVYSTTDFTEMPPSAVFLAARGNLGHYVDITEMGFGYVRP